MTLHILLMTAKRDGLVWVTERSAFLEKGHGNFATVEKIRHLNQPGLAFSCWGDGIAMASIGQFAQYATSEAAKFSDPVETWFSLNDFAKTVPALAKKIDDPLENPARGLLVATLGDAPRAFRVSFREGTVGPIVTDIYDEGQVTAGDVKNPANLFIRYYYPRSSRSIRELVFLGVHTVRLARALNSAFLGDPDVWVCEGGRFRQLTPEQVSAYERESESLDEKILRLLGKGPEE